MKANSMIQSLKKTFKKCVVFFRNEHNQTSIKIHQSQIAAYQREKEILAREKAIFESGKAVSKAYANRHLTRDTGVRFGLIIGSLLLAAGNETRKKPIKGLTTDLLTFAAIQHDTIQNSIDHKTTTYTEDNIFDVDFEYG